MEGRRGAHTRFSFRGAIIGVLLASAYVAGLGYYKTSALEGFASQGILELKSRHPKVLSLFQANFYFFYDEQFLPGIRETLGKKGTGLPLEKITILSNTGSVLFDSATPANPDEAAKQYSDSGVIAHLTETGVSVFFKGFRVQILMPSGQYAILYSFDGTMIRIRILIALVAGLLLAFGIRHAFSRARLQRGLEGARVLFGRFWRLRVKFLFTIVLINFVTAAIVFYTLSSLQTREQTQRIEKESVLFSQFSTSRVISDFTNYYYFYYLDRFLPEVKNTIASNENLVSVRIISRRTNNILFDSEQATSGPVAVNIADSAKADFSLEIEEQLKTRDLATRTVMREGQKLLSVISTYRNENQEALFWVEYLFSYQTLARSIQAIRQQILIDLVPSLALSILIAAIFAQFLISPIRRLASALRLVTAGDFNVSVDVRSTDEIGDLVQAFNAMTSELKKKKELRKYLSDSTYRQVMNATDGPDGVKLGGSRVAATVLFSDIRDFVGHCENLEAEEVTAMLNEYFSEMVEVVYKHGGEVDKFIGDALLAVFYAADEVKTIRPSDPFYGPSSSATALQAVYCALEMRVRLAEFNERRRALRKNTIEIGVGITHGDIISGPIGAKDRMDFTVIGDVVNLANRIEKLSKTGKHTKIVFSNHVEEKIRGLLDYVEHSREKVRGKQEDVTVYELIGIRQIDVLVANLAGGDLGLRRRCVELLGQSRNIDALPHVIAMLKDPDEMTRLFAGLAVSKLASKDHPVALDAVIGCLRAEKSRKVLSNLISSFGRICTTERILELSPYLDSPDERIVANVVESLGQIRSQKCTDLILPKLSSRNNRIKANAAMALFAAGHIEVIDTLKPMLMHSDPLMRSSAAFAIGELTSIAEYGLLIKNWKTETDHRQAVKMFLAELQECVPMLVALLRDPEAIVRRQSVIALGKIKDKSAVLPIIDMIDPERLSKELAVDIQQALRSIGSHKLVREVIARLS